MLIFEPFRRVVHTVFRFGELAGSMHAKTELAKVSVRSQNLVRKVQHLPKYRKYFTDTKSIDLENFCGCKFGGSNNSFMFSHLGGTSENVR